MLYFNLKDAPGLRLGNIRFSISCRNNPPITKKNQIERLLPIIILGELATFDTTEEHAAVNTFIEQAPKWTRSSDILIGASSKLFTRKFKILKIHEQKIF